MEKYPGFFMTFEGIDFAGKTTQIELLKAKLEAEGKRVKVVREPGGTAIGEKIRDILLDKKHLGMSNHTELFLFSASRSQIVQEIIIPELKAGTVIICDRFHDSTTAYQGYGREIDLQAVKAINQTATGGLEPDLTFLIDISVEEMQKRASLGTGTDRLEESGLEFFRRVRRGYLTLARSELRFHKLDGMHTIEQNQKRIWGYVRMAGVVSSPQGQV